MRRRGWLFVLPASAVVHAACLLLLLVMAYRARELSPLFIDLTALELSQRSPASPSASEASASPGGRAAPGEPGPSRRVGGTRDRGTGSLQGGRTPPDIAPSAPVHAPPPDPELAPQPAPLPAAELPVPSVADHGRAEPTPDRALRGGADLADRERLAAGRGRGPGSDLDGAGGAAGAEMGIGGTGRADASPGDGGAGGSALASNRASAGGAGGGSEYGPYLRLWRTRIHEGLSYPLAARRRNLRGTVQIEIVIEPNGTLGEVRVVESSSHSILDAAALESVKNLAPIPFPPHLVPRVLRARLPVVFDLR